MYGLKKEIDLSFLAGRELGLVAIGLYQVRFGFDKDVAISVDAEFRYFDGQNEWIWRQEPVSWQVAARTLDLLGSAITGVGRDENGTLSLTFSNGHRLSVLDSNKEYQSYDITRPGETIIV